MDVDDMEYLASLTQIATGIGSVGIFIGLLVAWKSGLLSFVWNLKKSGNGNGHTKEIIERLDVFETNHLHSIETAIEGLRRDLNEHANQELQLLTRISVLLETYGK